MKALFIALVATSRRATICDVIMNLKIGASVIKGLYEFNPHDEVPEVNTLTTRC